MLVVLVCVLQLVLAARSGSRKDLLEAIKITPEYHLLRNGQLTTRIRGADQRLTRPRNDIEDVMTPGLICQTTIDLQHYTRFPEDLLKNNLFTFNRMYARSSYKTLKEAFRTGMDLIDDQLIFSLAAEILDICRIVIAEDESTDDLILAVSRKRGMLKLITTDKPVLIKAILSHNYLVTEAMAMIEAHFFTYLAPVDVDLSLIEPSSIRDLGYNTLYYIYDLLIQMVSVAEEDNPTFQLLEEYPDLVQKLYQLLYLPDARERKHVEVILIQLFNTHPNLRKQMVAMLRYKYEEMRDYFSEDYAFIYHDILAVHRGFFIMVKDDPEIQSEVLQSKLTGLFTVFVMPLLAHTDLADYADQWTFIMLEIGPDVEDCLHIFFDYAFSTGTPHSHYHRDRETIAILDNIISETEMTAESMTIVIRYLFEKAITMHIRPSMQETMLKTFFSEKSVAFECFNVGHGLMLYEVKEFPTAVFEIVAGLRKLFISIHKFGFEMPTCLLPMIEHTWEGEYEFIDFFTRPGLGIMDEESGELTAVVKEYQLAKAEYLKSKS